MTKINPCELLAKAIVLRAIKDWQSAEERLRVRPGDMSALKLKQDSEAFFLSDWFFDLTSLDGGFILRKLNEEELANDKQRIL